MFKSLFNLNDPRIELVKKQYGGTAAMLWKISNVLEKLVIGMLVLSILGLILLLMLPFIFSMLLPGSNISCIETSSPGPSGSISAATNSINFILCSLIPVTLMLMVVAAGFLFTIYALLVLIISLMLKDYGWSVVIFIFGIAAIAYKRMRKF